MTHEAAFQRSSHDGSPVHTACRSREAMERDPAQRLSWIILPRCSVHTFAAAPAQGLDATSDKNRKTGKLRYGKVSADRWSLTCPDGGGASPEPSSRCRHYVHSGRIQGPALWLPGAFTGRPRHDTQSMLRPHRRCRNRPNFPIYQNYLGFNQKVTALPDAPSGHDRAGCIRNGRPGKRPLKGGQTRQHHISRRMRVTVKTLS